MFINNWKKEILTIPNLLSVLRLGLIPVYINLYLGATTVQQYQTAGTIIAFSCLTDAIDGKIARSCNMISNLGKILDPLADKLTQFTLTLCLRIKYPVLQPVLVLFIVKEAFQIILGAFHLRQGKMLPGALMAGKVCTTVLFISLIILVFFPTLNPDFIRLIAMMDSCFLLIAFLRYIGAYWGKHPLVQDLDAE